MILNILTIVFFVLGFALLFWMIVERRRDVLHYVTKTSWARPTMPADLRAQTSLAKQSRIVRYTEGKSENEYGGTARAGRTRRTGGKTIGDRSRASKAVEAATERYQKEAAQRSH